MADRGSAAVSWQLRDTLSGVAGACALTYAGTPFDVVKIRLQTAAATSGGSSSLTVLQSILKHEGVLALWRGATAALSSALVENAVVFTANKTITRFVAAGRDPSELTFAQHALIGGVSGLFSATAICPPEVVKCRLQAQRAALASAAGHGAASAAASASASASAFASSPTATGVLRHLLRTEGPRGLFNGLTPLLMRDVPFNTLFFGSYRVFSWGWDAGAARLGAGAGTSDGSGREEGAATTAPATPASSGPSQAQAFVCGGLAGMAAWSVVFPFDTLKSRMQTAGTGAGAGGAREGGRSVGSASVPPPPSSASSAAAAPGAVITTARASTLHTLRTVVSEGGLRALYRGYGPAVARAFPANAALFWGVETADRWLREAGL